MLYAIAYWLIQNILDFSQSAAQNLKNKVYSNLSGQGDFIAH